MSRFFITIPLLALALGACQQPRDDAGPPPLETEVVEPPPEAELNVEDDAQSTRRAAQSLSGVLPSDVPPDLPLHRPSTLVDFGGDGERYITFTSPARPQELSADMERRLDAAGWVREGGGESGVFVKGGRRITLTVEPDPVGSLWRVEY